MPPNDGRPPRLRSNTLRSRARASGQIAEAKSQTRQQVAEGFETQDSEDVPVALDEGRLQPTTGFLEMARPMEAAAEFDPQFPRQDVGPDDVRETDKGFAPAEDVRRRAAAFEFEEQTPLDDVNPQQGVAKQGDGFGLGTPARRRLGAIRLDDEFPQQDLTADDIDVSDDGVRADEDVQRRKAARNLEQQTPLSNINPFSGLKQTGDGFELAGEAESKLNQIQQRRRRQAIREAKRSAASQFDSQIEDVDIGRNDITRLSGDTFGLAESAQEDIEQELRSDFLASDVVKPRDINVEVGPRGVEEAKIVESGTIQAAPGNFAPQVINKGRGAIETRVLNQLTDNRFVDSEDISVDAGPTGIKTEFTQPEQLETEIEAEFTDSQFVQPRDVLVDVTEQGIQEARLRDSTTRSAPDGQFTTQPIDTGVGAVESRIIDDFTDRQFVTEDDVAVDVTNRGIIDAGIRDERRDDIAAREFEAETALEEVDPEADITRTDDGFGLTAPAERRAAAEQFDEDLPAVDVGADDVRRRDDGFRLTPDTRRKATAERIEEESPLDDVSPTDDLERDGDEFELDQQASERLFDLDPSFF